MKTVVTRNPNKQPEFVHIGERALLSLREQWIAEQRANQSLIARRGISAGLSIPGLVGANIGVSSPTLMGKLTKFDDAVRVREYLGSNVLDLGIHPDCGTKFRIQYLTGETIFHVLFIRGDQSLGTTNQIAYVANIETNCDGILQKGHLFLLAAYRHSTRYCRQEAQMTSWTPSSPEGLRYAFHIGRGDPPENFIPIAGYDLEKKEKGHLADEMLIVADGALRKPMAVVNCEFSAEIHGVFYKGDETNRRFSAYERTTPMPMFTLYGAPLVLREIPVSNGNLVGDGV